MVSSLAEKVNRAGLAGNHAQPAARRTLTDDAYAGTLAATTLAPSAAHATGAPTRTARTSRAADRAIGQTTDEA